MTKRKPKAEEPAENMLFTCFSKDSAERRIMRIAADPSLLDSKPTGCEWDEEDRVDGLVAYCAANGNSNLFWPSCRMTMKADRTSPNAMWKVGNTEAMLAAIFNRGKK